MTKDQLRNALAALDLKAPGLNSIERAGRTAHYWFASKTARARGFEPKTVPLVFEGTPADVAREVAARCGRLQGEMLEWLAGATELRTSFPPGTVGWLGQTFQTDPDSPYRERRQDTQRFYDENIRILSRTVGQAVLADITGRDVRRWYKAWGRPDEAGVAQSPRRAYACIQTLRRIVAHGCETKNRACLELAAMLSEMRFAAPKARSEHMTLEQSSAFRAAAHQAGRPSMALAVALQRGLALRQRDVVGEWVRGKASGIVDRDFSWHAGLLWGDHIRADMTLVKPTSKSNFTRQVEHDLKLHPDILAELALVPAARRVGPVIIAEGTGKPYKKRAFADLFREIARAAGLPDTVRNMDAKAGAVTEGYDSGAEPADMMRVADHTNLRTSQRYNRTSIEKTSRVARLVAARRGSGGSEQG